jgi:hypothetical protein
MKFGKSEKDITPHLLIAAIAAMLLYVAASWWAGSGESQQSAPAPEAKPEAPTAEAPDISIQQAAYEGNIEAVKQHLAAGTDVNAKTLSGMTPLHNAAREGRSETIKILIANGADVNAKSVVGSSPLDMATNTDARFNHPESADLLRKHGGKTSAELKDK